MEEFKLRLDDVPRSLELVWEQGCARLRYVDQRKLPLELVVQSTDDWRDAVDAIKSLAVRGAPAIGVAGAAALVLWASEHEGMRRSDPEAYRAQLACTSEQIAGARPTAVNLRWAVERTRMRLEEVLAGGCEDGCAGEGLCRFVQGLEREDEAANRAIGMHGAELLPEGCSILTHCNAGSLATVYYGTALGIVYSAAALGKVRRVYADETRPVGQGARLTAWELSRAGVPVTLICDNMAASLMAAGKVDAVIVGADRIARNGDTANKIGTYGLAVLAREHGIPFYVAAPMSTADPACEDGSHIVIEQRSPDEVLPHPIPGVDVWNPAFDVTPARFITRIVTENGIFTPGELEKRL